VISFGSSEIHLTCATGHEIISIWLGGTRFLNGTTQAAALVSGHVAYLLGLDPSLTPDSVDATIKSNSLKDVLAGVSKSTNFSSTISAARGSLFLSIAPDTSNALLNNGLF